MTTAYPPVKEPSIPLILRAIGARWRDRPRHFRMSWGELSFGEARFALDLSLFDDPPHYSLHIALPWLFSAYIRICRASREPHEMMETWGISTSSEPHILWLRWGRHYKTLTMPWHDWQHVAREVLTPGREWVPYVSEYDRDKEPDGRHVETHPYHYLLRNGEKQDRTATVYVDRMTWRLKLFPFVRKTRTYIDVSFNEEVGERAGSWKGGTVGCSYELKPNETPRECLRRMQQERRFT